MKNSSLRSAIAAIFTFTLLLPSCDPSLLEDNGSIWVEVVSGPDELTRATGINPRDFILDITDSKGKSYYSGLYGDSPEEISVPAGAYTVRIVSEEFDEPRYDSPQWGDEQVLSVKSGERVSAKLYCTQLNSGVALLPDKSFQDRFPSGTLYLKGNGGTLMASYGEKRTAFFKPGKLEVSLKTSQGEEELFSRTLSGGSILKMRLSASEGSSAKGIEVQVDSTREYIYEDYVYGTGGDDSTRAYNVLEAREIGETKGVWVQGFIVGVATGTGHLSFDAPFTKETNIALGLRANTKDKDYCLTIELKSGTVRESLNLASNPGLQGRQVYIKGDLVSAYFGIPGLKNISEFRFAD